MQKMSAKAADVDRIHHFAEAAATLNMLRNGESVPGSSASGIRCWGLLSTPAFPPDEESRPRAAQLIRARQGLLPAGNTLQLPGQSGSNSYPRPLQGGRPVLHFWNNEVAR